MSTPPKKIGIVSEHTRNDGEPLATLLERTFPEQAKYVQLCEKYRGDRLEQEQCFETLAIECVQEAVDIVIFVRDLDSDTNQEKRNKYFNRCKTITSIPEQIHLLFIYELEALALADFETTKTHYKLDKHIKCDKKAAKKPNPKGILKTKATNYTESDMRGLAKRFNLTTLSQNYPIWQDFIQNLSKKL